jgi:hypothetical protein
MAFPLTGTGAVSGIELNVYLRLKKNISREAAPLVHVKLFDRDRPIKIQKAAVGESSG